jgi:hypothetical protein
MRFFPANREYQGKNRGSAQKSYLNHTHISKFVLLAGKNFPLLAARNSAVLIPARMILLDLVLMMAKTRVLTILAIYQACIRAV